MIPSPDPSPAIAVPSRDRNRRDDCGTRVRLLVHASALGLALLLAGAARAQDEAVLAEAVAEAAVLPAVAETPAQGGAGGSDRAGAADAGVAAPGGFDELEPWLAYKRATHRAALHDEARLFYRRGITAARAGQRQDAMRLVRGAIELDPGFLTPHLTLASWSLTRDPSQALLHYGMALELVRGSFLLQIELLANLAFFTMHALFVGLVAVALAIVLLRHAELRHILEERIGRFLTADSGRTWAWVLLAVPFACGLGLALPALALLGLLWPILRSRERTVFLLLTLTLATTPLAARVLGRLAAPLRVEQGPLHGVAELQGTAWSAGRAAELAALAGRHPDNPVVQFGHAWIARQGGDLAGAEAAYRRAQALWPKETRVLNNLGNVLVAQGRPHEAVALYRQAIQLDEENAAAWFNLAQVYTSQFEFAPATEAAGRASAIDFDLVKAQQALGTDDGVLPLADQWLAPATFWSLVLDGTRVPAEPALPAAWRGRIESAGWPFAALALAMAGASMALGMRWQRTVPLRPCHNCGRVVCRRCAMRRRELALCPDCAGAAARAESPEFTNVLLAQRRAAVERRHRLLRTTLSTLVPGFGLLAFHRVFRALAIAVCAVLLTAPWLGVHPPFAFQSPIGAGTDRSPVLTLAAWIALYAISILGYLGQASRAAARTAALAVPVRSRPSQAATTTAKAA